MSDNPFSKFAQADETNPFAKFAPPPDKKSGGDETTRDILKSAASGIPKGLANVVGAYGDVNNLISEYVMNPMANFLARNVSGLPGGAYKKEDGYQTTSESVRKKIDELTGTNYGTYKPQTAPGRYAGAATEGAASGGRMGALSLLGGEAGEDIAGTPGRVVGTLATPFLFPLAAATMPGNADRMLQRRLSDMSPDDFAAAKARMEQARAQGIPLSPAEAMNSGAMTALAADTAATATGGNRMRQFAQERVPKIVDAVTDRIDGVASPIQSLDQARLKIARAADRAQQTIRKEVNAEVRPGYRAVEGGYLDDLYLAQLKNDPVLARAFETVRKDPDYAREIGDLPDNSFKVIDLVKKSLDDRRSTALAGGEANRARLVEGAQRDLLDTADTAFPGYPAARQAFADRAERIALIGEGATGRADAGRVKTMTNAISNPADAKPDDVLRAARALTKEDPAAFTTLVRAYMDDALDTAQKRVRGGGGNVNTGANFYKAVAGTPDQERLLNAMLQGVAEAKGVPPEGMKAGFKNLLEVLGRTDRIPGIGSPTAGRAETMKEAGQSVIAANIQPLTALRGWWRDTVQRGTFSELADVLTNSDPAVIDKLRKLSMLNAGSQKAQLLAVEIIGANRLAAPQGGQVPQ